MTPCTHRACRHADTPADGWGWDGRRWLRLCHEHLGTLRREIPDARLDLVHPLDGDPPSPLPDAAPAPVAAPTVQGPAPEPASPPQEPPCSPSTSAPSAPSSSAGACPGPADAPSSSGSAMPRKRLPALVLRPDPDADPALCRIDTCTGRPVSRGLCVSCAGRSRHAGRLEALSRPPTPRVESGKASGRVRAAAAPTSCRMPGCLGAPVSHGWCHMHHGRTRTLKVNAATITPDALVRAWGDYLRAKHPELQAPTGHGAEGTLRAGIRDLLGHHHTTTDADLLDELRELARAASEAHNALTDLRHDLRDLLGHPVTSTDAELLDAAREVKGERDRAEAEFAALGDLLTERGSASDDLPLLERARAVLDQRDSHLRHRDACLVELADVGEEIARLRIAYGLPDRALDGEVLAEAVRRVKATPPTAATAPQPATLDALLAACEDDGASPHVIRALRLLLGLTATDQRSAS